MTTALHWIRDNLVWLIPLAIVLLSSLATALAKYPKAGEAVKVLKVIADFLSILTHQNSPGTLKLPLTRSQDPEALQ